MRVGHFKFTFSLWTVTLCLASDAWTPAGGERGHLVGPSQPIVVAPGEDVVLPCSLKSELDVRTLVVDWSRPGPMSKVEFVLVYRKSDGTFKSPSFAGRASLFADELRRGNLSLRIANVSVADGGRYKCSIPKLSTVFIQLVVDPNLVKTWTTETPPLPTGAPQEEADPDGGRSDLTVWVPPVAVFVLLVLALGGVGAYVWIKQRHEKTQLPEDGAQTKPLSAVEVP